MTEKRKNDVLVTTRKTCRCNEYHPKTHFYLSKTGVCRGASIFLIFAPKHRLWVLVRTASSRRFERVSTIYVLSKNKIAPKHRLWVLVRTASPRRFERVSTIYVLSKNKKSIKNFLMKMFKFTT